VQALDGIKVLDLSRILAGPWCTQTLADLGADVWKVESPGSGDDTRSWMPPDIDGESTYFLCANRSKRSIAIDFRTSQGQEIVQRLAREADVLVENFRIGSLARYRLDYESLSTINPRLIYCSISGYGRTGCRATEAGYDFAIQAESGLMSITGDPDGEPMKVGVAITDLVTGMNATQAIMASLIAREKTGTGQFIDMSLLDSAVSVLANVASGYLATGATPKRFGNAHPTVAPYQIFPSADGSFALAVGNDRQFQILCCDVLERPDLAEDSRFSTNRLRVENRGVLIPLLQDVFRTRTTDDWLALLKLAGVPAGKVRSVPEVFASREATERGFFTETDDPIHGTLKLMRSPLALRGTVPRDPATPPRLGEHTDEILRNVLKASTYDIAAWRQAKIVA